MACPICKSDTTLYCSAKVLGKYFVQYFKCNRCKFIFTEKPYWLAEAYSSAITRLDIGLVMRNETMAPVVQSIINKWFDAEARFVDYGGGYGMLVRMMRDRGFDFYRQDVYCENLYAESFDVADVNPFKAELLTAFEVFEHLIDPISEIEKMLSISDSILFSTKVQPNNEVKPETWWYFTPETGQHVALYSRESLKVLANHFNLNYTWNEHDVHLFTSKKVNSNIFNLITNPRWGLIYNKIVGARQSLLHKDFLFIQQRLQEYLILTQKSN